jgi:hypothetical protein
MKWPDKTDALYDAYATLIFGGESEVESSFSEDNCSLIWYLAINAIIEKTDAIPERHYGNSKGLHLDHVMEDMSLDHVSVKEIYALLDKLDPDEGAPKVSRGGYQLFESDLKELQAMAAEFELDKFVTIGCPVHGDFMMKARDHVGENEERIAYGCFKCNDCKEVTQ